MRYIRNRKSTCYSGLKEGIFLYVLWLAGLAIGFFLPIFDFRKMVIEDVPSVMSQIFFGAFPMIVAGCLILLDASFMLKLFCFLKALSLGLCMGAVHSLEESGFIRDYIPLFLIPCIFSALFLGFSFRYLCRGKRNVRYLFYS